MRLPKLPRLRRKRPFDEHEWQVATARKYAVHLTETGSRCHLNGGSTRFCYWQAEELPAEGHEQPRVGVRCTIHPGGRFLDASARLDAQDFAPTRD